jgi:hypothetical protein
MELVEADAAAAAEDSDDAATLMSIGWRPTARTAEWLDRGGTILVCCGEVLLVVVSQRYLGGKRSIWKGLEAVVEEGAIVEGASHKMRDFGSLELRSAFQCQCQCQCQRSNKCIMTNPNWFK